MRRSNRHQNRPSIFDQMMLAGCDDSYNAGRVPDELRRRRTALQFRHLFRAVEVARGQQRVALSLSSFRHG
jgi:hypothetical protein